MANHRAGFSIMDLLISIAIFAIISVAFVTIFVSVVNIQTYEGCQADATQQGQFLLQQIGYYTNNARLIDMTSDQATSTVTLRETSSAQDPTTIGLSPNGTSFTPYITQGSGGAIQFLTSLRSSISNFTAARHFNIASSAAYGTDSLSGSFLVVESKSNVSGGAQCYSQAYQFSASVLKPVPKIALVQQTNTSSSNPSVSSLQVSYPSNNESGDLLIAVTANTTTTSVVSVSDTLGNGWSKIGSISYAAYNEELNVFAAPNAKNGTNTVTASFAPAGGFASLFTYEYRGAATSSSLTASSTQLNPSTQNPSSGSAAPPTSTVELLFGVGYNGLTAEVPAAGQGYTLETTSSLTHAFVEDMNQYVTGPVAASWIYTNTTPDSSALIVTFR